ncbi:MAG: 16S rRNA (uracil(1498)-N(3))-methyltransferase [Bacteroidia bacterium]
MNLFYTPDISSDQYTLSEAESKHCIRILRMNIGDTMHLTDGKGSFYKAEITDASPKKCVVKIIEKKTEEKRADFKLHIAVAPTKNMDRFEWFLEKATEIGIDEITPIISKNSERTVLKTERCNTIITSAVKQSLTPWHPKLNEVENFSTFIKKTTSFSGQKLMAHCAEASKKYFFEACKTKENTLVLIGPEGDFTADEINTALQNGWQAVSLGKSRLRTETAALVACHTVNLKNEIGT